MEVDRAPLIYIDVIYIHDRFSARPATSLKVDRVTAYFMCMTIIIIAV